VLFQYLGQRDAEELATARLRKVLAEAAPDIRDAVVDGFAFAPQALTDVASPATLDRVVENCLAIRLGDAELARETYADLREQIIRAKERWHDLTMSVALAPWSAGPVPQRGAMFVATVRYEYRVVPSSSVMRFSCVSDPEEYREQLHDPAISHVSYFGTKVGAVDASSPEAFDLVHFTVDGAGRSARRSVKAGGQTLSVNLGQDATGREVTISYTYRRLVQRNGHLFHLDISRPTNSVKAQFWYGDCGIHHVNVLDYIASAERARISRTPADEPTPSIEIGFDGWVLPKAGVAFVWVLEDEVGKPSYHLAR
jgi:hypothetical protein